MPWHEPPISRDEARRLVSDNVALLKQATEDDLDELLHDLLVKTHPTRQAQNQ